MYDLEQIKKTYTKNKQIIFLVGLSGSGKSCIISYLSELGYTTIEYGPLIRSKIASKYKRVNPNTELIMSKTESHISNNTFKSIFIPMINALYNDTKSSSRIIADGLNSLDQYEYSRLIFNDSMKTIGVIADKSIRVQRVSSRASRPLSANQLHERDDWEIHGLQKGAVLSLSDHFILNNSTLDELRSSVHALLSSQGFLP